MDGFEARNHMFLSRHLESATELDRTGVRTSLANDRAARLSSPDACSFNLRECLIVRQVGMMNPSTPKASDFLPPRN